MTSPYRHAPPLPTPYARGISAGHRTDEYEGFKGAFIDCPYPDGTQASNEWHQGFGDGTEDFIAYQRGDL